MALLRLTCAPLLASIARAGAPLRSSVASSTPSSAALASSFWLSARHFAAAAPTAADPGYTVTEVRVDKSSSLHKPKYARGSIEHIKGHTKKLSPLARQVTGKSVAEALVQMSLSPSQRAVAVRRAITKAVKTARDTMHKSPPLRSLKVAMAWTGKLTSATRIRFHSKGRAGKAFKRTSRLTVQLVKMTPEEAARKNRFVAPPLTAKEREGLDPRAY